MLRNAIKAADDDDEGGLPLIRHNGDAGNITGPVAIDAIGPRDGWEEIAGVSATSHAVQHCTWSNDHLIAATGGSA